jgi:hypothetical protein
MKNKLKREEVFSLLPYVFTIIAISLNYESLFGQIHESLHGHVGDLGPVNLQIILCFLFGLLVFFLTKLRFLPGLIAAVIAAFVNIYAHSGTLLTTVLLSLYVFGVFYLSHYILLKLTGAANRIEVLFLAFAGNYFLVYASYGLRLPRQIIPSLGVSLGVISLIGWFYRFDIGKYRKPSQGSFPIGVIAIFLGSVSATVLGLLTVQPIVEWDSMMGHIPTVLHFYDSGSIIPNPFLIESSATVLHQISSLPFFALGEEFGLKFFNLLFIVLVPFLMWELLGVLSISIAEESFIVLSVATISPPILLSTVGTFLYDTPLVVDILGCFYFLLKFFKSEGASRTRALCFFVTAFSIGILTKISFAICGPVFFLSIGWVALKRLELKRLLIPSLLGALFLIFFLIRSRFFHDGWFYPYSLLVPISSGDSGQYGISGNYIERFLSFIPYSMMRSDLYGQMSLFSMGFFCFLSALVCCRFIGRRDLALLRLTVFGSLAVALIKIQYARYLYFCLVPLALYVAFDLQDKVGSSVSKGVKVFVLAAVALLQLALTPGLNWWIHLPGEVIVRHFDGQSEKVNVLGSYYSQLSLLANGIPLGGALLLSPGESQTFYWVNTATRNHVVPFTWQANLNINLSEDPALVKDEMRRKGFHWVISPTQFDDFTNKGGTEEEIEDLHHFLSGFRKHEKKGLFNIWSLDDRI